MAHPASVINSVDYITQRITYTDHTGQTKTDRFMYLSKVDKLQALKFVGYRWVGKPGMHASDDEIWSAWQGVLAARSGETPIPNTPEEEIMETPKSPKVTPKKAGTEPQGGALEQALAEILTGVVGQSLTEIHAEVDSLRELVAKVQPRVTEIHLGDKEVRKIEGVLHSVFPTVLIGIKEAEPLWLVGPAGTGKSTLAEQAAQALGLDFSSKSCSSQTTEVTLLGYMNAAGNYVTTEFRKRYEFGGVFLLDEVDNGNPNVLTVLNSALSNGFMAFPDGMVSRNKDFVLVATANTFGNGATADYVGRNPIDKAFLDRFTFIEVNIDNAVEEAMLASVVGLHATVSSRWIETVRKCRTNAETYGLKVVVSPRATIKGAKWLRNGVDFSKVVDMTLVKGLKADQSAKLLEGVNLK